MGQPRSCGERLLPGARDEKREGPGQQEYHNFTYCLRRQHKYGTIVHFIRVECEGSMTDRAARIPSADRFPDESEDACNVPLRIMIRHAFHVQSIWHVLRFVARFHVRKRFRNVVNRSTYPELGRRIIADGWKNTFKVKL